MSQQPIQQSEQPKDSYVGRRVKGQVFGTGNDDAIVRTIKAKGNAVRRLERIGRRSKVANRQSTFAA